ncbi:sensor domain-containing diguanylate cyclase [Stutzerimonas tarimensis]|uniref:diguanylate cyclase n=1 Tax=Stutzerimonas tarimensis TaxID=1507735 RepID=A0ABV7T449_9GAMM
MFKIDLRKLILSLVVVSAALSFANSFLASYHTQRDQLMGQTLETNRAYAAKLADVTEGFFVATQDQLAYSAEILAAGFADQPLMDNEVRRLTQQSDTFNTALVVRADGVVMASSANYLVGQQLTSAGAREALHNKLPAISHPYLGVNDRLVVMISHPIYDSKRRYLGYVGGAIHLRSRNILHTLLGVHHYRDGSSLYVVDADGTLIYHEDQGRVGEDVTANTVVQALLRSEQGAERLTNLRGVDMLAGYARVPASSWGIVAQRPTEVTLRDLDTLVWSTIRNAIPLMILSLLLLAWLSKFIVRPLRDLANMAPELDAADAPERLEKVGGWYYEADRLKRGLLTGVTLLHQKLGRLNQENVTDPLTGLTNRRGLEQTLDSWRQQGAPFAVAILDVDHFKRVNDTYGHDIGDEVLRFLARQMRESARVSDLLCRSGGEEFVLLLPGAGLEEALGAAQRLCDRIACTISPTGEAITVSVGVADHRGHDETVEALLKRADQALYGAKRTGRNRVLAG